jgi:hypothetical protein
VALRIRRHLERNGLLERDAENSYLAGDNVEAGPMEQLLGSSITYRIALGPQQHRKVFTLQTLPTCNEPFDAGVGDAFWHSYSHAGSSRLPADDAWLCDAAAFITGIQPTTHRPGASPFRRRRRSCDHFRELSF